MPRLGYLLRPGVTRWLLGPEARVGDDRNAEVAALEDSSELDAAAVRPGPSGDSITVELSVCFSATYRVPMLCFAGYDACACARAPTLLIAAAGSPLPLDQLRQSTLFAIPAATSAPSLYDEEDQARDAAAPAHFPVVTPLEHPVTGRPCYSLHPCETAAALDAVLGPDRVDLVEAIRSWFALVGSVVDLRH